MHAPKKNAGDTCIPSVDLVLFIVHRSYMYSHNVGKVWFRIRNHRQNKSTSLAVAVDEAAG